MKRAVSFAIAASIITSSGPARASGSIFYGSRAGMQVTVISMSGLDTRHAIIRTRHTRADAIAFCRDYVQKVTEQCIREELSVRLNDVISANCETGVFTDFTGNRYRFAGKNPDPGGDAHFKIIDLASGQIEDGSNASGYPVNMGIFAALCPNSAPPESDW